MVIFEKILRGPFAACISKPFAYIFVKIKKGCKLAQYSVKSIKMDNQESKYIESIDIKGLWNRFDISWQLDKDVNILIGENGTGKSTILRSVVELFESISDASKGLKIVRNNKIESLKVQFFSQKETVAFNWYNENYSASFSILRKGEEDIEFDNLTLLKEEEKEILSVYYKNYKPDFINTFDTAIPSLHDNGKDYIKTNLNVELDILEKEFITYRFKKLRSFTTDKDALKGETYFYETVNRLFEATGKQLNKNDEKLSFITFENKKLHWSELSSGEKQFLIILMTVLCQDEKPSVLIMDEPEISLHLRWQYELIEIIRTLNPNCQLIIATHSPSIYGKGWRDKVTFIKDIIPQMQTQLA
jgi:ABC-type cobalamin/Fe3+-siderophores transport system ATPase subunit